MPVVSTSREAVWIVPQSFDELLLMKRGGRIIYFGPLGRYSCNMIAYFEVRRLVKL